jgi:predicted Zn-dependent protease
MQHPKNGAHMRIAGTLTWLAAALSLTACGTNPVTGKTEIQFISEAQEIRMGEQYYAPTQQSQGGQLDVLPELTTYVNEVGQNLAAVARRESRAGPASLPSTSRGWCEGGGVTARGSWR